MRYVLDSSVAVKWVLNEPLSAEALKLREEYRQQLHDLLSPDTFVVEVAHALTRAERKGIVPVGKAADLLADVLTTRPTLHSYLPLVPRAVELSSQLRIGVYDCLYAALSEREGCEIVTADDRLVTSLSPQFPVVPLSSL